MGVASLPGPWEEVWIDYEILKGRSLSVRTLENYKDTFGQLARFVGSMALEDVTRRHIAAYLDHVTRTASGTTAAMRYRGLSAVFRVMSKPDEYGEALLARNPMAGLTPPKTSEVPPPVLKLDEVNRLLGACHGSKLEDLRDQALIRFMYDTGARRGEVKSMRIDPQWLNLREGTARIDGKTGQRDLKFGQKTGAAIFRYMRARRRTRWRNDPALWIGHRGPLKGNGIYQALARRFGMAGIKVSQAAHVFRHTFSHVWQKDGGSVPDLVALNGWKSGAMALRYAKSAAMERAHEAHRRLSPGERLR
jgi:site-specific recombinase XerD